MKETNYSIWNNFLWSKKTFDQLEGKKYHWIFLKKTIMEITNDTVKIFLKLHLTLRSLTVILLMQDLRYLHILMTTVQILRMKKVSA